MEQGVIDLPKRKRFALKRYFSLTSLLCTILIALLLGWSYQYLALSDLKNIAEGRNNALTKAFANALWPKFSGLVNDHGSDTADELLSLIHI